MVNASPVPAGSVRPVTGNDHYVFRPDLPKHTQIADELRGRIVSGDLAPRLPLPSEPRLMQEYGVARDTARKAVAILRNEGYVVTQPGMGTFVRDKEDWPK